MPKSAAKPMEPIKDTAGDDIALDAYVNFHFLDDTAHFYETEGKLLGLKTPEKDYGQINAYRMFPLSRYDTYISILDKDKKEIGVVQDVKTLPPQERELVENALRVRYFLPVITKFIDIKEEFNYTFFKVETTAGYREITVFDMNVSLVLLPDESVLLTDIDGNRYLVFDLAHKGKKALRYLEIWL